MVGFDEKLGKLNEGQREAVLTTDGPVLIIAGPGTGKTKTLVDRTLHLILDKGVKPDSICLTTFTRKAAEGLFLRISQGLKEADSALSPSDLLIGNFHMLSSQIVKMAALDIRQRPAWEMLDDAGQRFIIYKNLSLFKKMDEVNLFFPDFKNRGLDKIPAISRLLNRLREGFYDLSGSDSWSLAGKSLIKKYRDLLAKDNKMDFSELLILAYEILRDNKEIREYMQDRASYLMVDEYQDTNPIQEKIIRLLQEKSGNICVVGDDDQSLYRFRGARVGNLLTFAKRYDKCRIIKLSDNYRSDGRILERAQDYLIKDLEGLPDRDLFRLDKNIIPADMNNYNKEAAQVIPIGGESWPASLINTIKNFRAGGMKYDQMVMLASSLKSATMLEIRQALRNADIKSTISGSEGLAAKRHIKRFLASLFYILEDYIDPSGQKASSYQVALNKLRLLKDSLPQKSYMGLDQIRDKLRKKIDQGRSFDSLEIFYSIFSMEEFENLLDLSCRPASPQRGQSPEKLKDLAYLMSLLRDFLKQRRLKKGGKAENLLTVNKENISDFAGLIFTFWYPFFDKAGLQSSEDDKEIIEDVLPIMTIHQAKGLEFPLVFLIEGPIYKPFSRKLPEDNLPLNQEAGPLPDEKSEAVLDRARLYYTGRTRAQYALVECRPAAYCKDEKIPLAEKGIGLKEIEKLQIKGKNFSADPKAYAYTSDIERYEYCPRQYLFFRQLSFPTYFSKAAAYGSLVHESLQYLQEAYIKGKELIDRDFQKEVLQKVYGGLWKSGLPLTGADGLRAAKSLADYFSSNIEKDAKTATDWGLTSASNKLQGKDKAGKNFLKEAKNVEKSLRINFDDFILYGNIDLILNDGSIVDFKTSRPSSRQRDLYRDQLLFYSLLTGKFEQGGTNYLYYTEEDRDQIDRFEYSKEDLKEFLEKIRKKIKEIEKVDCYKTTEKEESCLNCPFRQFCRRGELLS